MLVVKLSCMVGKVKEEDDIFLASPDSEGQLYYQYNIMVPYGTAIPSPNELSH